jgi:putative flippase GtrA
LNSNAELSAAAQSNWIVRFGRPGGPAPLARWLCAGLVFLGINTLFLKAFVGWCGFRVLTGTFVAAEFSTLLRFFVNDHWVFGNARPTWNRLWRYQVANTGALIIWWAATNLLAALGIQYLLAGILAVGVSTGFSLASNFFWIWRRKQQVQTN